MVRKKKESYDTERKKYIDKPSSKKYVKAYKKAGSPEVSKKISSIYSQQQASYDKQRAEILTGQKDSRVKARTKEQLERIRKGLTKAAKTKMSSKKVLKKNKMGVHISEFKAPSILGDDNRFFKGEMNAEKRNMFFE